MSGAGWHSQAIFFFSREDRTIPHDRCPLTTGFTALASLTPPPPKKKNPDLVTFLERGLSRRCIRLHSLWCRCHLRQLFDSHRAHAQVNASLPLCEGHLLRQFFSNSKHIPLICVYYTALSQWPFQMTTSLYSRHYERMVFSIMSLNSTCTALAYE